MDRGYPGYYPYAGVMPEMLTPREEPRFLGLPESAAAAAGLILRSGDEVVLPEDPIAVSKDANYEF